MELGGTSLQTMTHDDCSQKLVVFFYIEKNSSKVKRLWKNYVLLTLEIFASCK